MEPKNAVARTAIVIQGAYYFASGLWPLLDMQSFERVTGPKVDKWLVKTVGALVTTIGGALMIAGLRRRPSPEARVLSLGSAIGLTAIDVYYVAKRRIAPIYLADAAAELVLLASAGIAANGFENDVEEAPRRSRETAAPA